MRKRMYLQLFEDGTGVGSNGQGGNNAGNGNGNQGNAGETGNQQHLVMHRQKRLHKRERSVQKDRLKIIFSAARYVRGSGYTGNC